jgi:ribulose-phosphate 3-epimerase
MIRPDICPTITVSDEESYNFLMKKLSSFAGRIQIDLADGEFAPAKLISIDKIWWPANVRVDLHVMYRWPFEHTEALLVLRPQLIIVHAEAEGDFVTFAEQAHAKGVEVGVALLAETPPQVIEDALEYIDHVLIFSGKLGFVGGTTDYELLKKVHYLRKLKPTLEIGWDGGVSDANSLRLVMSGVDVLNVGKFISKAENPEVAYKRMCDAVARLNAGKTQ